ncbi:cyclopropane-fatty-acyl-phospholipid synthase family protein [Ferrovibrio sp.]|uniref:SAM-dependent methyltransferase n=1 Tax=Ferrovibrio sp. TaxID=1917215 RepID=UPI00260F4EF1|nr:class I SAM-dependent methyltransferase [Ferrovibrio sp.]
MSQDHWNTRFSGPDYLFGTAPNAFLQSQAFRLPAAGRALAVADGEGRNGVWLARQGLQVHAIDFSPVALEKARRLAAGQGVVLETEQADLSQWAWPEAAYDVVAAIFIQFAGPPLRQQIFSGIRRALRPGGLLLLQGYRPEQLKYRTGGPSQAENLYTRELLETAFGDCEILHLEAHDSVIHEGSGHDGMSALIDLAARKPHTAA